MRAFLALNLKLEPLDSSLTPGAQQQVYLQTVDPKRQSKWKICIRRGLEVRAFEPHCYMKVATSQTAMNKAYLARTRRSKRLGFLNFGS